MTLRKTLVALLVTLLAWAGAAAQAPPAGAARPTERVSEEEKEKARKEAERQALLLLDEVLRGALALKLEENRAVTQGQAAALLWEHDEKRARALFREAVHGLAAAAAADASRNNPFRWMLEQLRPQLLQAVAARDPQFALELLRESRPQPGPDAGAEAEPRGQELVMEQTIAAMAADRDPKAALRMAEESLRSGVTFGALTALERLRRKDAEAATRLAGEIIRKLGGADLNTDREAGMVALSLLHELLTPAGARRAVISARPALGPAERPKPLALEDGAVRDLAELVAGAALKESFGQPWLLSQLQGVLPELEKRVPARAAQLRQRAAEMEKALDPRERAWMQFQALSNGGAPEAALEAAAKAPAEMRPAYYSLAVMELLRTGETERARRVATDHLRGDDRERLLEQIDLFAVAKAVEKGKPEEARQLISSIRQKERRAGALTRLALALAEKGERKAALSLLAEARDLLDRRPDSQKEVEALLEVARGYALVEPAMTFEIIDPMVDQANDMLTAAALLDKFTPGQGMFRKGEMLLYPGMMNISGAYGHYVKALAELARIDFERTRAVADRFGRDEVRLLARLIIARSVLSRGVEADPDAQDGGVRFGAALFSN